LKHAACDILFDTKREIFSLKVGDFGTQYRQRRIFDGSKVGNLHIMAKIPLILKIFVAQTRESPT